MDKICSRIDRMWNLSRFAEVPDCAKVSFDNRAPRRRMYWNSFFGPVSWKHADLVDLAHQA
jgi:hypothetical protein